MSPVSAPGRGGLRRRGVSSEGSTADIQRHVNVPGYRLRLHLRLTRRYLLLSFNLLPLCLLCLFFLPLLFPL